ncbi:hypothetical protein BDW71DRAFT_176109 [Aspergillus fruticulosus]
MVVRRLIILVSASLGEAPLGLVVAGTLGVANESYCQPISLRPCAIILLSEIWRICRSHYALCATPTCATRSQL